MLIALFGVFCNLVYTIIMLIFGWGVFHPDVLLSPRDRLIVAAFLGSAVLSVLGLLLCLKKSLAPTGTILIATGSIACLPVGVIACWGASKIMKKVQADKTMQETNA